MSKLPFDLKQYRAKDYSTHFKKFAELIAYLKDNMDGAISGNVSYSNPVKDFMTLAGIESNNWFCDKPVVLSEDTEKGFLDFLAEIEENATSLLADINQMSEDMESMSGGISKSTEEINRVNKVGGSGTASFVRKEAKKVAGCISEFSSSLRKHNNSIETLWDGIEKNTLGLLENQFAVNDNNKESLKKYMISLRKLQSAITESNISVDHLKETMNAILGLERSMNQAIRFCIEDLSTYISNTQRMVTSVDKILAKSKFVVGDISCGTQEE